MPMVVFTFSRLDVLKPKTYSEAKNAKKIDNFLWGFL